jgi:hypothetical protein
MEDDQKRGGGSRRGPKPADAALTGFSLHHGHDSNHPDREELASAAAAEAVLDRLADALFALDEILGMLQRAHDRRLDWLEPHILKSYDEVNDLMKRLSN